MSQGDVENGSHQRIMRLYHFLVALLAIHFVVVYAAPQYLLIPQRHNMITTSMSSMPTREFPKVNGVEMLYTQSPDDGFDVSEFRLNPAGLNYGLGREAFPALIKPVMAGLDDEQVNAQLTERSRVLLVKVGADTRVYPVDYLMTHEVVNDVVGGRPIFAAFCVLADLGAVYDRQYAHHTLTFGVSGWTYHDLRREIWGGMDAFVLWDRETESLWWPPLGRAISGPLVDTPLKLLDDALWKQTTWGEVKREFPSAVVLKPGQDFERPSSWPRLEITTESLGYERLKPAASSAASQPATQHATTQPAKGEIVGELRRHTEQAAIAAWGAKPAFQDGPSDTD